MKALFTVSLLLLPLYLYSESAGENAAKEKDPFAEFETAEKAPEYSREVDRSRGSITLEADGGEYRAGSHFGNWYWTMEAPRSGHYLVGLLYESTSSKLGIQIKVGEEAVLKGYAPRTNSLQEREPMVLGKAHLSKPGEHSVVILTGAPSNIPAFQVHGVHFQPAPATRPLGQSIDGSINLAAENATTYSREMHYQPEEAKQSLGDWRLTEDWAEWKFDVTTPGVFDLEVHYGCAPGHEGSEIAVLVNGEVKNFTTKETGGFQSWQSLSLGKVDLDTEGVHRIALIPEKQASGEMLELRRIELTPES